LTFADNKREEKDSKPGIVASVLKIQIALNFLKNATLILCNVVSKYLKYVTFSTD